MKRSPIPAWVLGVLALEILGACVVRLLHLGASTMGHTEIYVPNIELPTTFGNPRARLTLVRTIVNSLWEPHPPAWYVMMWGWTKAVGTSLIAIRLPSVFFGALSVVLIFVLGLLEDDAPTAVIGAGFLAFNGLQVLWSQIARPSTLVTTEGLLSSVLLLAAGSRRKSGALWLYALTALAGLATEHYFWFLFAGQMLFVTLQLARKYRAWQPLLSMQILVLIAASPLLTLAVFQGGAPYLDNDALRVIEEMVGFGFLFEQSQVERLASFGLPLWMTLVAFGAALLLLGVLRGTSRKHNADRAEATDYTGPGLSTYLIATVIASAMILAEASVFGRYSPSKRLPLLLTLAVPSVLFGAACSLRRYSAPLWDRLSALSLQRAWENPPSLVTVMTLAPVGLAALATQFQPLLAARQLMVMIPFVLLLLARGLMSLRTFGRRAVSASVLVPVLAVLAVAHGLSVRAHLAGDRSPHDYHAMAEQWRPEIRPNDLIFVADHFRTTPIFYYLKPSAYRFFAHKYADAVAREAPQRVWVFGVGDIPESGESVAALRDYVRVSEVDAGHLRAALYVRSSARRVAGLQVVAQHPE